jgi:hypothetical protein
MQRSITRNSQTQAMKKESITLGSLLVSTIDTSASLKGSLNKMRQNDYNYTLKEVSDEIGLCTERVRQIEIEALKKVRAAFEAKGITSTALDDYTTDPSLFDIKKVLLP